MRTSQALDILKRKKLANENDNEKFVNTNKFNNKVTLCKKALKETHQ